MELITGVKGFIVKSPKDAPLQLIQGKIAWVSALNIFS